MDTHTVTGQDYPRVAGIVDAVAHWVTRYRERVGSAAEFSGCTADEVARMARDLGVTPKNLENLAGKGPGAADLLRRMLVALGVDPARLAQSDPGTMRDLQRLCVDCDHKRRCRHEFDAGTAGDNYRQFCPNAYTLDALLAQRGH